jgi:hypothetical protein
MKTQQKIDLLCFLTKAKENQTFYKLHRREINLCIRAVKASINFSSNKSGTQNNNKSGTQNPNRDAISNYVLTIVRLVTEYLRWRS